jgi:3-oxoacyl-[acyl-carrier-protein] synthase-3
MNFNIEKIEYALGEESRSISKFCIEIGRDYERLIERSGFITTHTTNKPEQLFFSEFLESHLQLKKNDSVVLVNQSASNRIPGVLPSLFSNLSNSSNMFSIELSDGCSGFVKGLFIAQSLLGQFSRVHLICAEKYSNYYSQSDSSLVPIFSDAISLTTLTPNGPITVIDVITENSFIQNMRISLDSANSQLTMEGANVYGWVMSVLVNQIETLLSKNGLTIQEVTSWHLHQASKVMIEGIQERLGLKNDNLFSAAQIGNTVSSSIPIDILMTNGRENDLLLPGHHIVSGFGVGLTAMTMLIRVSA